MTEIPQTRQSLLIELGKQSDEAWAEFLSVYEKALYRFCIAKGLQDADAQDVLQDVLTAVLKRLPSWDANASKGSFRGWLFRVARNISVDAIAHRAKKTTPSGDPLASEALSQLPSASSLEDTSLEVEYQRSLFDWAAKQVKSEVRDVTWKAFSLTAIEGQKAESVAQTLGISVGSVYTAKCRVVARMRSRIADMEIEMNSDSPRRE